MKLALQRHEIIEAELDLTGTCNLDCPLCLRSLPDATHLVQKNIRPVAEWIAQLDTLPSLKFICLAGSVSEPTMYKDIIQLLEYLVSRNIMIEINTNGNTHNTDWWENLGNILTDKDKVLFTVCGSTQELHEKYRVGSNLAQILKHAAAYRKSGKTNDWLQHIRFEYNAEDLDTCMAPIINQFSHSQLLDSHPYQERFNMTNDPEIKMYGKLGEKYNTIAKVGISRQGTNCKMRCKSYETKFISIDQFGEEFPCFLYRIYRPAPFSHTDYSKIHEFKYKFCYECESLTTSMLERNGMETMI